MTTTTVGILFSDIEGSTRLLQQLGPAYATVLLEHHEVLRAAFARHGGEERGNEGDSFFITFMSASEAIAAALDGQRALAEHPWPPGVELRVRMGVHVGEIQTVAGTIVGMPIHEAARIGAAAHGGQVLVSAAAAGLVGSLPESAAWLELGEHRLKDISEPMGLFQLTHRELMVRFPPVRSQGSRRTNLPAQASSFVGRARELAEIGALIGSERLVTLTGAGGAGKTRLALRAAADQSGRFADGVCFVDLAPLGDESAVAPEMARALGLPEAAAVDLVESLGQRELLLLVDNCEHLVEAVCEVVVHLLRSCPAVQVLATSREPLGVPGEMVWRVPPLDQSDAAEMFETRARAVSSRFEITAANRAVVDDVCARLDAIPLALELAAARLGALSVEQLADRLDQRFRLLAGTSRGATARHRTLQATVDWSYDLLEPEAKNVLRRLGTFVGGFTLGAAEAVCVDTDPLDLLDLIDELVAKSLVVADDAPGEVRYRLLETLRHYALDRLIEAGEIQRARDLHLRWLEALALDAEPVLWFGGDERAWLTRLDQEDDNVRAGLEWAIDGNHVTSAVHILFGLSGWFAARGRAHDGLEWARRLAKMTETAADRALNNFAEMYFASNAGALSPEIIDRVHEGAGVLVGSDRSWVDPFAAAYAAAWSYSPDDPISVAETISACERAVEGARAFAPAAAGWTLQPLLWVHLDAGNLDAARACGEEALALTTTAGLSVGQSRMSVNLARIELAAQDPAAAWRHAERAVEVARATGDTFVAIVGTRLLAQIAEGRGDAATARDLLVSVLDAVAETQSEEELDSVRASIARCEQLVKSAS